MAAWIDKNLENYIKKSFPERIVVGNNNYYKTWQSSRYIQVSTCLLDDIDIHYEYYQEAVELHLENKYQSNDYRTFVKKLRQKTLGYNNLQWLSWQGQSQFRCRILKKSNDWGELRDSFMSIMEIFDPIIKDIYDNKLHISSIKPYDGDSIFVEEGLDKDSVCLATSSLGKLFSNKLVIPSYQRNYCWEDKQIKSLWNSLKEIPSDSEYHLGTIILQKTNNEEYAIIDGQQRLVTLSLISKVLNYTGDLPLLNQKFLSESSKKHIANAKWLIGQLSANTYEETLCSRIINKLIFSVLILKESRLDLAYTFFSNENSKGIPLTDFDLLKAHHLRYISSEKQAEHLSSRWNNILKNDYELLNRTMSCHLLRLRKWMRKNDYNPKEKHIVKDEFSTAIVLQDIPAFGENFDFYEKIQGGSHFFGYTESFVRKYQQFCGTKHFKALKTHLQFESHWKYSSIIETLLFGYYLKFGEQYLAEALFCIASSIAQHRYENNRALSYKIREYACKSEIVMMVDQASSPTFFLAECLASIHTTGRDLEEQGIAMRFYQHLQDIFNEISDEFTDSTIIKLQ